MGRQKLLTWGAFRFLCHFPLKLKFFSLMSSFDEDLRVTWRIKHVCFYWGTCSSEVITKWDLALTAKCLWKEEVKWYRCYYPWYGLGALSTEMQKITLSFIYLHWKALVIKPVFGVCYKHPWAGWPSLFVPVCSTANEVLNQIIPKIQIYWRGSWSPKAWAWVPHLALAGQVHFLLWAPAPCKTGSLDKMSLRCLSILKRIGPSL